MAAKSYLEESLKASLGFPNLWIVDMVGRVPTGDAVSISVALAEAFPPLPRSMGASDSSVK